MHSADSPSYYFIFNLIIFRLVEQKELITALIHNFQRLLSWTTFLKNCRSWSFSFMTSTVALVMSNQQISWEKWNVRWDRYEISYILHTNTIHQLFCGIEEYYDKQCSDGCSQLLERFWVAVEMGKVTGEFRIVIFLVLVNLSIAHSGKPAHLSE